MLFFWHHNKAILVQTTIVRLSFINFNTFKFISPQNPLKMDLKSLQVNSHRRALHKYPGIRINQVRWNRNDHRYYAIGFQAVVFPLSFSFVIRNSFDQTAIDYGLILIFILSQANRY